MDHTLESHVITQLAEFSKNRSMIIITHRTTLLPLVDRLIMLDKGAVKADGARDDIIKQLGGGQ